jgi:hypothetical protein
MVNHLTSCILEAKNIAVPNVVAYRYKIQLTQEISDLIRLRNQCRRSWGQNKNRELKRFMNKLTEDIKLRVFALRGIKWGGLLELCRRNQTKLKNRHRTFLEIGQLGLCDEFRKFQSYCKCVFK